MAGHLVVREVYVAVVKGKKLFYRNMYPRTCLVPDIEVCIGDLSWDRSGPGPPLSVLALGPRMPLSLVPAAPAILASDLIGQNRSRGLLLFGYVFY